MLVKKRIEYILNKIIGREIFLVYLDYFECMLERIGMYTLKIGYV